MVPAYRGGDTAVAAVDTQGSVAAPVAAEIAALAESLQWNPVRIYEWVQNNIKSEWYWGSMKGAEQTLLQKSGNDADQAALLVALLRASNYPARYVRGAVEFFPGIEAIKNITGLNDPFRIAAFFQRAGIPFEPVIAGGRIANFRIEHVWVEAQVPYSNYRGALIDEMGKVWVGLDTHIKPSGYIWNEAVELPSSAFFEPIRNDYLSQERSETPLEYLRDRLEQETGSSYDDYLLKSVAKELQLGILPASLQFTTVAITGEYTELPEQLRHRVTFTVEDLGGTQLFTLSLDAASVASRQTILTFEPETVEDQRIIDSYGGLDNTPAYLVRLRPVLQIDGERTIVSGEGLPMGAPFTLTVTLDSPAGSDRAVGHHVAGNMAAIGIACQQAVLPEEISLEEKDAGRLLFEEALTYIDRWNEAEREFSSLLKSLLIRPLPTVVTVGGVMDVVSLFDVPQSMQWKGVFIDAGLRRVETVAQADKEGREKQFMRLSALQGSVLENRIFEDDFGVASISTAKALILAQKGAVARVTLDGSNVDAVLPTLDLASNVVADIEDAVHRGLTVYLPETEISYESWNGIGYIKENPKTGEGGYMLSGMIAGGMTAWDVSTWSDNVIKEILKAPFTEHPNTDPAAAFYFQKISATDMQRGTVDQGLGKKFEVRVLDKDFRPVKGVEITFTIKAGGGYFKYGEGVDRQVLRWKTNAEGISDATFILGKETSANPAYWMRDPNAIQVGENLIDAELPSGKHIDRPFTAFGFPDVPHHLTKASPEWVSDHILAFIGTAAVRVEDKHNNPIANEPVRFTIAQTTESSDCAQDPAAPMLISADDVCVEGIPVNGECGGSQEIIAVAGSSGKAYTGVMLGGEPRAQYSLSASSKGLTLEEPFIFETLLVNACDQRDAPYLELGLRYAYMADAGGQSINAGAVGSSIQVVARAYVLREGETIRSVSEQCGSERVTCPEKIVGNGSYVIETVDAPDALNVTFGGQPGQQAESEDGIFTGTYALKPGLNEIPVTAIAEMEVNRTDVCSGCDSETRQESIAASTVIEVYGVDVQFDDMESMLTDGNGSLLKETVINYSIEPASYRAKSAYVILYAAGEQVAFLPAEKSREGFVSLARGFNFDLNKTYEVEVVLNYGTGSEIRSQRKSLDVYGLVLKDGDKVVDLFDYPYVFIKAEPEPQMPKLKAQVYKAGGVMTGQVKWRLKVPVSVSLQARFPVRSLIIS